MKKAPWGASPETPNSDELHQTTTARQRADSGAATATVSTLQEKAEGVRSRFKPISISADHPTGEYIPSRGPGLRNHNRHG